MSRPRTVRRELARTEEKLARDRERLFLLEPGGMPDRPIEVASASLVEPRATSIRCPRCLGALRIEEHTAEVRGEARLRVVRVKCAHCGARRAIYFRIAAPLPS